MTTVVMKVGMVGVVTAVMLFLLLGQVQEVRFQVQEVLLPAQGLDQVEEWVEGVRCLVLLLRQGQPLDMHQHIQTRVTPVIQAVATLMMARVMLEVAKRNH